MLSRVEDFSEFPGANSPGEGEVADVQPLWPGIRSGRPKPIFAYPIPEPDYLDFEAASEARHEYVDGYVYAMAGASDAHNTIQGNLVALIRPMLRGTGCKGFFSDMRMAIFSPDARSTSDTYYYPDYFITCSESDLHPDAKTVKKQPCLVIEVLSPGSTETVDRTEKLDNYQRIPSLEQYWLVEQDRRRVMVYTRTSAGWLLTEHTNDDATLELPLPGLAVQLGDLYEDVFGV
jgi:Uma2 family endonuclease